MITTNPIDHESPEQLTLLPPSAVPLRFRLDEATRRRGRQHVAEIRELLADRQAKRADVHQFPVRVPVRTHADTHAA